MTHPLALTLTAAEYALNQAIRMDPDHLSLLAPLDQKLISIHCTDLNLSFSLYCDAGYCALSQHHHRTPDVTFRAKSRDFIAFLYRAHASDSFPLGKIEIDGNIGLSQHMLTCLKTFSFDLEEKLSYFFGDVFAFTSGEFLRNTRDRWYACFTSMKKNLTEYLQEELLILPPQEAFEDLFHDIDRLRCDISRFEARLERLS